MCKGTEGKDAYFLLTRYRKDYKTVVSLVTVHNLLTSHVSRMDITMLTYAESVLK